MKRKSLQAIASAAIIAACLLLVACAAGNRYDYGNSISGLPVSGSGKVALAVVDLRPYVQNGTKTANFVGIQRGGFGNPFDVRTGSGRPLADEMRDAIARAMENQGYTVLGPNDAAPRKMELRVAEWKTDVMARMKTSYDMALHVYDGTGALLAQSRTQGEDVGTGGFESGNATNAAHTFELHFTQLVRDEGVRQALTVPAQ